ncbi:MAG: glycosyltransferase family 4 protein [Gammaproteobacteria bacterium]|nr:glycosyltransferase family 4 protein [Gammaproteobacteria bacterium]
MRLIIDATNIADGGGVTHLYELLSHVSLDQYGIERVLVFSCNKTLNLLPDEPWLSKESHPFLEKSLLYRFFWQLWMLPRYMQNNDLLFIPGGVYLGKIRPFVTMHQNQLPFELSEIKRYPIGKQKLRLKVLRRLQLRTFKKASGIIFLSEYSKSSITKLLTDTKKYFTTIPHGIAKKFSNLSENKSEEGSFRLLYVSRIDPYKRHREVIEAVARLKSSGLDISLQIVGQGTMIQKDELMLHIKKVDPYFNYIKYDDEALYSDMASYYRHANAFIFMSGCETFGMVLLEAMAAGLPIICSNRSSMPEILQNAGRYCDPDCPDSIVRSIAELYNSRELCKEMACKARLLSRRYCWKNCADSTFLFLQEVAAK